MIVFHSYCRPFIEIEMPDRPKYTVDLQKIEYIDSFIHTLDCDVNLLRKAIEENDILLFHNVLNHIETRCIGLLETKVKPMLDDEIKKAKENNRKM